MQLLALNTAFETLGICLTQGGRVVFNHYSHLRHLDEWLFPTLDLFCQTHQVELSKTDYFVVNQGPGSYTGLRMGQAVMKSLAQIHGRPLIGVHALDYLASLAVGDVEQLHVLLNCTRNEVFYAIYHKTDHELTLLEELRWTTLEQILPNLAGKSILWERVASSKKQSLPLLETLPQVPRGQSLCDALPLIHLARRQIALGLNEFPNVLPHYIKKDV